MCDKPLVSVITPAYNTGKYISKLLDSILTQSYLAIEMIVMDDGSTDNTADIVKSYIPQFRDRGYQLNYQYQENSGQSVAINNALKLIKGKYLVWPDSDDYYSSSEAIKKMVDEFEKGPDSLGMVRTQEKLIKDKENGIEVIGISGATSKPYYKAGELFESCLYASDFYFCPGAYMVNISKFVRCNGLEIYTEKDAGQNWQIMLPILYSYDCKTIMEPLYNVVVRADSHSRGQYKGYEAEAAKFNSYRNTILSTLDKIDMPISKREYYKQQIIQKYQLVLFNSAFRNAQYSIGLELFNQLPLDVQRLKKVILKKILMQLRLSGLIMANYKAFVRLYRLFR